MDSTILDHALIITDHDLRRLLPLLDQHDTPAAELLAGELHRAVILDQRSAPPDVVTMNSEVVYQDHTTGVRRRVRVVFPRDADAERGWVSVLAPIGSALLGLRVGQEIDWRLPTGARRLSVVEIQYQPEAAGDYHL